MIEVEGKFGSVSGDESFLDFIGTKSWGDKDLGPKMETRLQLQLWNAKERIHYVYVTVCRLLSVCIIV